MFFLLAKTLKKTLPRRGAETLRGLGRVKRMETSTTQTIVRVYAVLAWIAALFMILSALGRIFFGYFGGMMGFYAMGMRSHFGSYGSLSLVTGIIASLFLIAVAVFAILVGIGLWKYRPWARTATFVLSILAALGGLITFFWGGFGIVTLVIGGFGIWLFGFEKTVTTLFTGAAPVAKASPAATTPATTPKAKPIGKKAAKKK